ncbi:hypothetical protein LIPSTDRAFT_67926 [Lipomyces starkeyi NRRL Y-11557]|uniref:Uncharacterized protein n=1 Tax=Lipomyces starkeyi NRRL Y-11557 TaxID=675824 RepID=A0A1E3QCF9_LIPST|nr:hypothetical protein LIPSTDRAFT_67926 [Lipomyces starkeyi NRRL Y-11557]
MHRRQAVLSLLALVATAAAQLSPACPTTCTTTETILSPTSTGQLTLILPTSTTLIDETFLCAVAPTVSGFPATSDMCVQAGPVTFFLGGVFVGPTPVCTSESFITSPTVATSTITVPAVFNAFGERLIASVNPSGAATPDSFCFSARAQSCPAGFTAVTPTNSGSFISTFVDASATGKETLVFQGTPTTFPCCPDVSNTPDAGFSTVSVTRLCGTPSASGFPTCSEVTLGSATFTLSATYTADPLTCTSTFSTSTVLTSTSTANGIPGMSVFTNSFVVSTATDGKSASAYPLFCVDASVEPQGICSAGFTSSTSTGAGSFTSALLSVTATGTLTTAVDTICTVSPTAYTL